MTVSDANEIFFSILNWNKMEDKEKTTKQPSKKNFY